MKDKGYEVFRNRLDMLFRTYADRYVVTSLMKTAACYR